MLLTAATSEIGGIRIASAANMIGLLTSWTVLAVHEEFSAAEAFLVVALTGAISIAGVPVSFIPSTEGGVGGIMLALANLWAAANSLWYWSVLVLTLPNFDTNDETWFFAKVRLQGWFRIFMLVSLTIQAIMIIGSAVAIVIALRITLRRLKRLQQNGDVDAIETQFHNEVSDSETPAKILSVFGACVLILTIASVEMTIRYNNLTPVTTLSSPGQIIPLTIGIVVLVDGIVILLEKSTRLGGRGEEW